MLGAARLCARNVEGGLMRAGSVEPRAPLAPTGEVNRCVRAIAPGDTERRLCLGSAVSGGDAASGDSDGWPWYWLNGWLPSVCEA